MMSSDKRNSFFLASQYVVTMIVSLLGLKLNLLTYGTDEFGIWLLLLSIWGVGAILDLGFSISLIRFIARNRNDKREIQAIIATGFIVFLLLGAMLMGLGIGIAELFYFNNPTLIPSQALPRVHIVHYFLAGNFFFQYMTIFFRALFEGHEDFIPSSVIAMTFSGVLFIIITIVYALHLPLTYLGAGYCLSAALQLFTFYVLFKKKYPALKIEFGSSRWSTFKSIFQFSAAVQGTFLIGAVMDPVIKYIMGMNGQPALITVYEIARRFATAVSGLFSSAFRNSLPRTSAITDNAAAREYLYTDGVKLGNMGISYSGILFGVLSFIFTSFICYFYKLPEGILIFFICTLAESVNNTGYFLYVFIIGTGRSVFLMIIQSINLVFVTLFLIAGFNILGNALGLIGFYVSVLLGNIVILFFLRSVVGIDILELGRKLKYGKLIALHMLLFVCIALLSHGAVDWLYVQGGFTLACGVIFFKDAIFWGKNVQSILMKKGVALT